MLAIGLNAILMNNYSLIIDVVKKLAELKAIVARFHMMVHLLVIWTPIFCGSLGAWVWYGQRRVARILFAAVTPITRGEFRAADRVTAYRGCLQEERIAARHDEVWGG